jgi:hypothetical protein
MVEATRRSIVAGSRTCPAHAFIGATLRSRERCVNPPFGGG